MWSDSLSFEDVRGSTPLQYFMLETKRLSYGKLESL